jgi:FixJ family two-component response regulator
VGSNYVPANLALFFLSTHDSALSTSVFLLSTLGLSLISKDDKFLALHTHNKFTILVIDDDKDISDNLARYLTENGYSTANTYTGQKGLELIKRQHPHIALVDLKLPDINGIELLKSIKTNSHETIIILMSGYATIDATAESIKHGAYDFIAKPFNFNELELTLRRAIEIKTRKEKLTRLKKRNIILTLTLPLWVLLGYIIVSLLN